MQNEHNGQFLWQPGLSGSSSRVLSVPASALRFERARRRAIFKGDGTKRLSKRLQIRCLHSLRCCWPPQTGSKFQPTQSRACRGCRSPRPNRTRSKHSNQSKRGPSRQVPAVHFPQVRPCGKLLPAQGCRSNTTSTSGKHVRDRAYRGNTSAQTPARSSPSPTHRATPIPVSRCELGSSQRSRTAAPFFHEPPRRSTTV